MRTMAGPGRRSGAPKILDSIAAWPGACVYSKPCGRAPIPGGVRYQGRPCIFFGCLIHQQPTAVKTRAIMAPKTERRIAVDVVLGFSCCSSGWFKGPVGAELSVVGVCFITAGPLQVLVDHYICGAHKCVRPRACERGAACVCDVAHVDIGKCAHVCAPLHVRVCAVVCAIVCARRNTLRMQAKPAASRI